MWEELYEEPVSGSWWPTAPAMSGSRELAEDLVQETFVKALQNADILEDLSTGQRRAWLYRTFNSVF